MFENKYELRDFLLLKGRNRDNALQQAIGREKKDTFYFLFEHVFCKYLDFKEFAFELNHDGENFLHLLTRFGSPSMLNFALPIIKKGMSPDDLKKLVKLRSRLKRNIFHFAAQSRKDLDILGSFIENEVGKEGAKKMLGEMDKSKYLPLHYITEADNLKIFDYYLLIYERKFSFEELKVIMNANDDKNENIFSLINRHNKDYYKLDHPRWTEIFSDYQDFS